jgi:hypothetical protein
MRTLFADQPRLLSDRAKRQANEAVQEEWTLRRSVSWSG